MGRTKTPTNLLTPDFDKRNPDRARTNEPEGAPHDWSVIPQEFGPGEARAWRDIVAAAPPGVLTASDQIHVEMMAKLVHYMRKEPVPPASCHAQLRAYCSELGLSPSGRAGLQVDKPTENPFDDL